MEYEKMVRNAVNLAKKQGVEFSDKTPTFRPAKSDTKTRFHVTILTNTTNDSAGHTPIDEHFNVLDKYNEKSLANHFIDVFNKVNIVRKAKRIE